MRLIAVIFIIHSNHCKEGVLRDRHFPELLHSLLTFGLFLQQLLLSRDVAAVALGQHVLHHGADLSTCDGFDADTRLNWYFELLPRDQVF